MIILHPYTVLCRLFLYVEVHEIELISGHSLISECVSPLCVHSCIVCVHS